ncbi:type 1 glutamine amidotransferase [Buchananella hordeovulneris]|uniref:Lipid II isoglutaminyl synthase (glutamine-hydrolyzing) subunit GatD n=1 Tax=Buchananella hordeovulneris TaxID=52770 RepID=A0A1Q5PUP0_9ACTO|nr:glutamine amidotransferase [Buchananella hordeovulneris]OKL51145.1 glutamine amidotransferase [Buchananella hordeovulneris]
MNKLAIGLILPDVLGTYGDSGNAVVLRERARRRGIDAEIVTVHLGQAVPDSLDIYTLGGGEDIAQSLGAAHLRADGGLGRAVERGAPLLAICAGLQVLGEWFIDAEDAQVPGCGILDVRTRPRGSRMIGELVLAPSAAAEQWGLTSPITGFENHGGLTELGEGVAPLGEVCAGYGNGLSAAGHGGAAGGSATGRGGAAGGRGEAAGSLVDGAVHGSVIATYAHGPVLARNPQLADALLARALGVHVDALEPLEIAGIADLRAERLAAVGLSPGVE